jgi:cell division protein FtsL
MSGPLEHAEHTAHAGHSGNASGKYIGLTMAVLGVLLAFCAAKVGSERTELTKALVEQSQAQTESQANQMKYRLVMLEAEKLKAGVTAEELATNKLSKKDSNTLDRVIALYSKYSADKEANKAWVNAYQPLINAHFIAAEHFELAQLMAEIGIVIASIALLMTNRLFWFASLIVGSISVGLVATTYASATKTIADCDHKIEEAQEAYLHLRKVSDPNAEDQRTIQALDPSGNRRAAIIPASATAHGTEKAAH